MSDSSDKGVKAARQQQHSASVSGDCPPKRNNELKRLSKCPKMTSDKGLAAVVIMTDRRGKVTLQREEVEVDGRSTKHQTLTRE